jgi:hypothetical protein
VCVGVDLLLPVRGWRGWKVERVNGVVGELSRGGVNVVVCIFMCLSRMRVYL